MTVAHGQERKIGRARRLARCAVVVGGLLATTLAIAPAGAAARPSTSDAAGVESLQRQLDALGCNAGTIDGKLGPNTVAAIRWFQAGAGITVDGVVGPVTTARLAQAASSGSPNCRSVPAPPAATGGAAAACTLEQIRAGAQAGLLPGEQMVKSGPYQCAGGFAYNAPTVSSGGKSTRLIELLRWNGTAWQAVDRGIYCESGEVPKLIYARTCLTGNTNAKTNAGTSDAASVQRMQRELNALGCNAGTIDGKLGPRTTAAVRWFQSAAKLPVDGVVGPLTGPALTNAAVAGSPNCRQVPAPPAPPRNPGGVQCTEDAIKTATTAALNAGERLVLSGPFQCAGIWAYNGPTIANSAGVQTQVNELVRWNGTAWQVVNRAAYCESGGVPAAVAQEACQT